MIMKLIYVALPRSHTVTQKSRIIIYPLHCQRNSRLLLRGVFTWLQVLTKLKILMCIKCALGVMLSFLQLRFVCNACGFIIKHYHSVPSYVYNTLLL